MDPGELLEAACPEQAKCAERSCPLRHNNRAFLARFLARTLFSPRASAASFILSYIPNGLEPTQAAMEGR
jgi:hypothetical protein